MLFPAIEKVPARAVQRLLDLLEKNAIPEIPEAESEALKNWMQKTAGLQSGQTDPKGRGDS